MILLIVYLILTIGWKAYNNVQPIIYKIVCIIYIIYYDFITVLFNYYNDNYY